MCSYGRGFLSLQLNACQWRLAQAQTRNNTSWFTYSHLSETFPLRLREVWWLKTAERIHCLAEVVLMHSRCSCWSRPISGTIMLEVAVFLAVLPVAKCTAILGVPPADLHRYSGETFRCIKGGISPNPQPPLTLHFSALNLSIGVDLLIIIVM